MNALTRTCVRGRAHTYAHLDIATRERAPGRRDDLAPKSARSGPSIETGAGTLKAAALQTR